MPIYIFTIKNHQLLKCVKKYNLGDDFIKWVTILNYQTQSSILNNGWLSRWIALKRGIRQGCPLSALIFILATEVYSCKIRQSKCIKGIPLPNEKEAKLTQYADDLTLFLSDENSITKALSYAHDFYVLSGLKINKEKTQAMWIGSLKLNEQQPGDITWKLGKGSILKILGINFCNSKSASEVKENWESKIDSMKSIINSWSKRNVSVKGRVVLIKSLIISQITHLLMVFPAPSNIIQQINSLVLKFLWQGVGKGKEKLKRKLLTQDYEWGGLKAIDIEILQKSLILKWVMIASR